MTAPATEESIAPSRRRWIILVIIFCAIVLNYFDRQIVSILKPTLLKQFQIDDRGYATLVNVFTICYACMYPVAGWMVDRFGARRMMLIGIVGWSTACIGAGLSPALGRFTFFRGMLGLAEPIAFPSQLQAVTVWFPGTLRATANSICVCSGTLGAIIAPPLVAWMTLKYGWKTPFLVPGVLGLIVAIAWIAVYREPPVAVAKTPATSDDSSADERAFAWASLLRTRSMWGILLGRFVSDPVWYFCLFWLPGYLQEKSGLSLAQIGMVGWIPFLVADIGGIGSAAWSDWMVARGRPPLQARKVMLVATALLAPTCILTTHFTHPAATLAIFSIVGAVCLSWLFSLSVVIAEAFPRQNIGSVLGIAAGFGAAGAMIFNFYVGRMMATLGAGRIFAVMAVLHPIAAIILWLMVRKETAEEKVA